MLGWILVFCVSGMGAGPPNCATAGPFVSPAACEVARKAVEKKFPASAVCVAQDPKSEGPPPAKGG